MSTHTTTTAAGCCTYLGWDVYTFYSMGEYVCHNGKVYLCNGISDCGYQCEPTSTGSLDLCGWELDYACTTTSTTSGGGGTTTSTTSGGGGTTTSTTSGGGGTTTTSTTAGPCNCYLNNSGYNGTGMWGCDPNWWFLWPPYTATPEYGVPGYPGYVSAIGYADCLVNCCPTTTTSTTCGPCMAGQTVFAGAVFKMGSQSDPCCECDRITSPCDPCCDDDCATTTSSSTTAAPCPQFCYDCRVDSSYCCGVARSIGHVWATDATTAYTLCFAMKQVYCTTGSFSCNPTDLANVVVCCGGLAPLAPAGTYPCGVDPCATTTSTTTTAPPGTTTSTTAAGDCCPSGTVIEGYEDCENNSPHTVYLCADSAQIIALNDAFAIMPAEGYVEATDCNNANPVCYGVQSTSPVNDPANRKVTNVCDPSVDTCGCDDNCLTSGGGGCENCGCTTEKYYGTVCSTAGYDHENGHQAGASVIIAGCCSGSWTYPTAGYQWGVAIDLAKPNCLTYLAVEFTADFNGDFNDVSSTENGNPDVMISSCCGYDCNNPT